VKISVLAEENLNTVRRINEDCNRVIYRIMRSSLDIETSAINNISHDYTENFVVSEFPMIVLTTKNARNARRV
jgi:hypothetical protein